MNDRKSTTGYYFNFNGRGAALSWGAEKQTTIAFSSSEAEYQGMAATVQEALCLKQFLENFGIQKKHPIATGEDNQSCIKWSQNSIMHKRSNHIEPNFHFIRDKTADGTISNIYVPTDKMAANIFKKIFSRIEGGDSLNCFDLNGLYAISSSLSGVVRIMIKL